MTNYYVDSFLQLTLLSLITVGILLLLYYLLGFMSEKGKQSPMKTQAYSGGRAMETHATFFKSTFFQYAIYFLIFDVVAFITAISTFLDDITVFRNWKFSGDGIYVIIYLLLVLSLFIIFPKHEEEII